MEINFLRIKRLSPTEIMGDLGNLFLVVGGKDLMKYEKKTKLFPWNQNSFSTFGRSNYFVII